MKRRPAIVDRILSKYQLLARLDPDAARAFEAHVDRLYRATVRVTKQRKNPR